MNDNEFAEAEHRLILELSRSARGPKRNGVFALWLFVHVCGGVLPPHQISERAHARRLQGLERRLSSLSVPPPLRRALATALTELAVGSAFAASIALYQLVTPARETVGAEVANAIGLAARYAKQPGDVSPQSTVSVYRDRS